MDSDKSLSSALLKTKVLASRLNDIDLLDWATKELKGYSDEDNIPEYRTFVIGLTGTYINGLTQYNNQPIPTIGLNKEIEKKLTTMTINQSVVTLESIKGQTDHVIENTFPAEITGPNWTKLQEAR